MLYDVNKLFPLLMFSLLPFTNIYLHQGGYVFTSISYLFVSKILRKKLLNRISQDLVEPWHMGHFCKQADLKLNQLKEFALSGGLHSPSAILILSGSVGWMELSDFKT